MSNQKRGIPAWYWFFITFFGGGIILISIVAFFVIVPFNLKFPDEAKQALDQEIQSHSQIGEHVIGTTRYDIKKLILVSLI